MASLLLSVRLEIRMNDGAVPGQRGSLDQLVLPIDGDLLVRLVDKRLDKGEQVACIEAGGRGRDAAGQIRKADDLDAVDLDGFAALDALNVAAAFNGKI